MTTASATNQASKLIVAPVPISWHPGMPIYAAEPFLRSEGDRFGWIGGTDDRGALRCILPYTITRKAVFELARFRTATIAVDGQLELAEEKAFLAGAVECFRKLGADIIIPSGNTAIFRTYPDGAAAAPYGTFIMDLNQPETTLMSEIRKTFRQNIRKAAAAGVEIKCGPEYLEVSYRLVAQTLQRSKVSFKSYREYSRKIQSFGECVKVFVAEYHGDIHACMVAPFSQHTAYNCYAGSRPDPALGAMHMLHWEAIRQFRSMGVQHFDFQGVRINPERKSKQAGIMHYKQGFGGKLIQGFMWKYPLKPLKSLAYSLAVRLLMGADIVDQEGPKISACDPTKAEVPVS